MRQIAALVMLALIPGGCTDDGQPIHRTAGALSQQASWSRLLVEGDVTLAPGGLDRRAAGPSAVAVAPDGAVLVLDQLGQRLLQVTGHSVGALASVPTGAMDLALAADGAFVIHDRLRSLVRIHGPEGALLGELPVPRVLEAVVGVALGPSRQVWLQDAHQQRYLLGSPSAPQTLEAVLHSQRAGQYVLPGGEGLQVRVGEGGVTELWLVRRGGTRDRVVRTLRLAGKALAARVVGAAGTVACLRLEREAAGPGPAFRVEREATCVDTATGAQLFSRRLPDVGAYLPRRELALGGAPLRLAHIRPEAGGLRVTTWVVDGEGRAVR